jgi:hypothetical protein
VPRWSCLALLVPLGVAGCADWRSLYGVRPEEPDAAPPMLAPDQGPPDLGVPDASITTPDGEAGSLCQDDGGPLVLWKFEGVGPPSPDDPVPDLACRPPDVPLGWDLERPARATSLSDHALFLDGGFLFSGIPQSDEVGRDIIRTRSITVELWLGTQRTENGTIFSTAGGTNPGRAFAIEQKDGTLRFAVRSTATDADGSRLVSGGPAEVVVPFARDPGVPVHVVGTYASATRTATLYVDGTPSATVIHGHTGTPAPVWQSGKNELGLGGTFEGAPWRGWIFLVALYDRALSDGEVKDLFARGPRR